MHGDDRSATVSGSVEFPYSTPPARSNAWTQQVAAAGPYSRRHYRSGSDSDTSGDINITIEPPDSAPEVALVECDGFAQPGSDIMEASSSKAAGAHSIYNSNSDEIIITIEPPDLAPTLVEYDDSMEASSSKAAVTHSIDAIQFSHSRPSAESNAWMQQVVASGPYNRRHHHSRSESDSSDDINITIEPPDSPDSAEYDNIGKTKPSPFL
ncbi:hypothetical protein BDQ17DRAFT_349027 [Cyathus striatus]|nr:hypothetical protein BDQ17DRAFT_349027 [Cyathus striatus]